MHNDKPAILAQNSDTKENKSRLRWLVALSSIPLFGMVAAFGIAPSTDTRSVPIRTVIQELEVPVLDTSSESNTTYWREEKIQRGDTIATLLERLDVADDDIASFLRSTKNAKGIRQLVPGRTVRAKTNDEGELIALRYISSSDNMLTVEKERSGAFHSTDQAVPLESRVLMKSGEIRSSLFGATDAANIPDNIAIQLADVFSSDIDFHQDLRKGDRFTVVYEVFYHKGEPIKTGKVLAAEFTNQGKIYKAIYFESSEGGSYYTPDGKSLRKAFLKSPLEFSRITSGFTNARYHPVLQEWRAHKGVDYGAPIGTRVKATGDGTVEFVGKQGGYGNMVSIKHQGQYSTVYGHLSGFAKGLHKGSKITQGEVIGYVGMTGLATGPHLHYEFKVGGIQRNPLTVALPTSIPLAPHLKADFAKHAKQLQARLELLRNTNLAALD